jgi:glucose-6-phosphate 1-dehydrogenase
MSDQFSCPAHNQADPVNLVIFGATGDLAMRKIYPALASLCRNHLLSHDTRILAVGRTPLDTQAYRALLDEKLSGTIPASCMADLGPRVSYLRMDPEGAEAGSSLSRALDELDRAGGKDRLFYLAVPPAAYIPLATLLGEAGLAREDGDRRVRIVVEKPFGHDLASARELDGVLHRYFHEKQIFRIDHYMAKETVQNVLMLRFANALFEPVWNRRYIDHIRITAAESLGIGHRAGFYDQAGVLRDMFQNHMMMLLSLCAMEPPSLFEDELVRDERSKVFRALRPLDLERLDEQLVLGQYGPGMVDGSPVPGYLQEPGVRPDSTTPTFASMKVYLDNWRWQGVPFHLCSGKRMSAKHTEISVQFKNVPVSMFRKTHGGTVPPNRLILGIHPEEVVRLEVQTKGQGSRLCLQGQSMEFSYGADTDSGRLNDYAKVLLDCVTGDQTLFWRQDAVELCWGFLTPILDRCDCPDRELTLHTYPAGGPGPKALEHLGI